MWQYGASICEANEQEESYMESNEVGTPLYLIAGCSAIGAAVAAQLCAQGKKVAIVDIDKTAFQKLPPEYTGQTVVANAIDIGMLTQIGIQDACMVLAVTDKDNTNIVLGQIASRIFKVPHVIVKLCNSQKELLLSDYKVHIIAPNSLAETEIERMVQS